MSMSTLIRSRKSLAAVPAAGLVLLLAGCGGTTAAASSAPADSNNTAANNNNAAGNNSGQGRNFPGAQGKIADISGKTLQVQNDTTQTAVTYTSSTKMSQTVSASKSDLAVGKCVSVRPVQNGTDAPTGAAPTQADDSTPIEAGSVSISDATNGSCNGGFGGGAGFGGGRGQFRGQGGQNANSANGQAPTNDSNAQAPTGGTNPNAQGRGQGPRAGGFGGGGANGTITKIDGDTVTVETQRPQFNQNGTAGSASSSAPTMTTVTRTVTLSSSTTYTKSESASASDLKVGKCVTALGSTDSNGTLTATTIALRPADSSGSCTAGMFGGFGGRRGGGNGTAGNGTATTAS